MLLFYVHIAHKDGEPRTATSTFTQFLSDLSERVLSFNVALRPERPQGHTQLLSSEERCTWCGLHQAYMLCNHRNEAVQREREREREGRVKGWLSVALRPQKPSTGLLGTGAQDGHLDLYTAPGALTMNRDYGRPGLNQSS